MAVLAKPSNRRWLVVCGLLVVGVAVVVAGAMRSCSGDGDDGGAHAASARQNDPAAAASSSSSHASARAASGPVAAVPSWFGQRGVRARRIAGRVTFAGLPVADAEVRLSFKLVHAHVVAPVLVRSDARGQFDLGLWPAEGYWISAGAPGRSAALREIDLRDPKLRPPADRLELVLGGCDDVLSGTVADGSGGAIAGARIERDWAVGVASDAAGHYELCLPRGASRLYFTASGYGGVVISVDVSGRARRDVVLVPEGLVSGRIVRASDGAAVEGAVVSAWTRDWGPDRQAESWAVSDANGRFELSGLAPGTYAVWAAARGLKGKSDVVVEAGQSRNDLVVSLTAYGRVVGKVVQAGKPVAGAAIVAIRGLPYMRSLTAVSQDDGSFELEEVPPGEVSFTAHPYEVKSPARLLVAETGDTRVVLEVGGLAAIRGHVRFRGQPARAAVVRAGQLQAISDDDGAYALEGLAAGEYALSAHAPALGAFGSTVHVALARGEQREGVDLDLPHAATIAGTLVDQRGAPVPDAVVTWRHSVSGDVGRASSAPDGSFRCDTMTGGGVYRVTVGLRSNVRLAPATGAFPEVNLVDGAAHVEGVRLVVRLERLDIRGRVIGDDGAPVADATVSLQALEPGQAPLFPSWQRWPTTTTDVDGGFRFEQLAEGRYALSARSADGGGGVTSDVAAGARDVLVRVQHPGGIRGTLVGFSASPSIYAQPMSGSYRQYQGSAGGTTFELRGLPAGRYLVTAQNQREGASAMVAVSAGATAEATLRATGSASVAGIVVALQDGTPAAGMACLVMVGRDDMSGVGNWDAAVSARSDARGQFVIDPVPAGPLWVLCHAPGSYDLSSALAHVDVAAGERAQVTLRAVRLTDPQRSGTLGLDFDPRYLQQVVASVRAGGPAAVAGVRPGDRLLDMDGVSLENVTGMGFSFLVMNHALGDRVTLTVARPGLAAPLRVVAVVGTEP